MWQIESCEICGSLEFKKFIKIPDYVKYNNIDSNQIFNLMKCSKCKHCFSLERLTREELREIYNGGEYVAFPQYSNPDNNDSLAKIAKIFIDNISNYVHSPVGKKMFEIGCSYGHLLNSGKTAGFLVKGIEPSRFASNYARKNLGLDVSNCTIEDFEPGEEKYEIIIAISVFEHVYDLEKTIQKIKKMMHKDSIIYLEVPSLDTIQTKLFGRNYIQKMIKKKKGIFHPVEHVRYFTQNSMNYFLKKHFQDVKQIQDPRWKTYYKYNIIKDLLAKTSQISPTGNILFLAGRPIN